MKNYQKAEMIAKNLPTGSYAAGCPVKTNMAHWDGTPYQYCGACELDH